MHITCSKRELHQVLKLVQHATTTSSTLSILGSVLLATEGKGRLRLSATDLEIGITCTIAARVKQAGHAAIPVRRLLELVTPLPAEERLALQLVEAPAKGEQAHPYLLVGGRVAFPCADAASFPRVRPMAQPESVMVFQARQFKEAVAQVAFAAAPGDYESTPSNVWIVIDRRRVTSLSACDGARCALLTMPVRARKTRGSRGDLLLVPAQSLARLACLLPDVGEVQLAASAHGYLRLRSSAGEYITRLNSNEEVGAGVLHDRINEHTSHWRARPFAQYIPERPATLLVVGRKALLAALRNQPGPALVSIREDGGRSILVIQLYSEGGEVTTCELPVTLWGPAFAHRWVNPHMLTCALNLPGSTASLVLGFVESSSGSIVLRWLGRDGWVNPAYSYACAPLDPYSALEHPFVWGTLSPLASDLLAELGEQSARSGEEGVITRLRAAALHLILAILHYRMEPSAKESGQALQRLRQVTAYPSSYFLDICRDQFVKLVPALAVAAFAPGGCVLEYDRPDVRVALDADQVRRALESKAAGASARTEL